jgi:hypothetical protein
LWITIGEVQGGEREDHKEALQVWQLYRRTETPMPLGRNVSDAAIAGSSPTVAADFLPGRGMA